MKFELDEIPVPQGDDWKQIALGWKQICLILLLLDGDYLEQARNQLLNHPEIKDAVSELCSHARGMDIFSSSACADIDSRPKNIYNPDDYDPTYNLPDGI